MNSAPKSTGKKNQLPSPTLLNRHSNEIKKEDRAYIRELSRNLEKTLESFGIDGYVPRITVGPCVTRFEISLAPGVRVDKVIKHQKDIAVAMKTEIIRIQAPIPGKDAVGVEIPNRVTNTVYLRSLLESKAWNNSKAAIPLVLGCDIDGKAVILDLAKAPHLLIAASSQSEKYNCLNSIIMSLLFRFSPDDLKLIMIDPMVVDFEMYRPLPHLMTPIINDPEKARLALDWGVSEMERRYKVLKKVKAKNLATFNSRQPEPQPVTDDDGNVIPPKLPIVVIIMNELSDAVKGIRKVDVETDICRIAQKGRAVGIHLVIATQFPQKQVVTGLIKANIPTKIAFHLSDIKDSRVILDSAGAEKLLGNGDMLFNPPEGTSLERIQGAFISGPEIAKVIDEIAAQCP